MAVEHLREASLGCVGASRVVGSRGFAAVVQGWSLCVWLWVSVGLRREYLRPALPPLPTQCTRLAQRGGMIVISNFANMPGPGWGQT